MFDYTILRLRSKRSHLKTLPNLAQNNVLHNAEPARLMEIMPDRTDS